MKFLQTFPFFILLLTTPSLQTNLKIVNTRYGSLRPEPCATICAGETGPNPSYQIYNDGQVEFLLLDIDVSKCGFVETPIVTVHLEGDVTSIAQWTHAANRVNKYGFRLHVTSNTKYIKPYRDWNFNIMWSAFGYNC